MPNMKRRLSQIWAVMVGIVVGPLVQLAAESLYIQPHLSWSTWFQNRTADGDRFVRAALLGGVVSFLLIRGLTALLREVRRDARARQARCANCGYDLRGTLAGASGGAGSSGGCPECGAERRAGP
jgi:hypothetical protein